MSGKYSQLEFNPLNNGNSRNKQTKKRYHHGSYFTWRLEMFFLFNHLCIVCFFLLCWIQGRPCNHLHLSNFSTGTLDCQPRSLHSVEELRFSNISDSQHTLINILRPINLAHPNNPKLLYIVNVQNHVIKSYFTRNI